MKKKILFVTNRRTIPYGNTEAKPVNSKLSSGLVNSITFVVDMLKKEGFDATYVQVDDGNDVDRWVHKLKPTHVIIEALWVTPAKLAELTKLHKNVKWIIRLHSEIPFLANEGIAFEWLFDYVKISNNVSLSANSKRMTQELSDMIKKEVAYLPNYYQVNNEIIKKKSLKELNILNIGCFGAIRPMKNQLMQAVAAIKFSEEIKKNIIFHININREETNGLPVLKNLRSLFKNTNNTLVEHQWSNHTDFIHVIKLMDIGMQVSLSETYNIVTADLVNNGIPVVVSPEINFVIEGCKADPTSYSDIVKKLMFIYSKKLLTTLINENKELLEKNSNRSIKEWLKFLS